MIFLLEYLILKDFLLSKRTLFSQDNSEKKIHQYFINNRYLTLYKQRTKVFENYMHYKWRLYKGE